MTDTDAAGTAAGAPATPSPAREPLLAPITRWTIIVHAALLAAQPFLAGAMLDAMSPTPQLAHKYIAMTLVAVSAVQVLLALAAWKGKASWPKAVFTVSTALFVAELGQFTLGHMNLSMAMHIPLGILVLALGVYLAVRYGRKPQANPRANPQAPSPGSPE